MKFLPLIEYNVVKIGNSAGHNEIKPSNKIMKFEINSFSRINCACDAKNGE